MKSRITTNLFALILLVSTSLSAQTYWSEDFANGALNWEMRDLQCGTYNTGNLGQWVLTSATQNGTAVAGLEATLHLGTERDFIAQVTMNGNKAIVQARYGVNGDVFETDLTSAGLTLDAPNYGGNGDKTDWFTSVNLSAADLMAGGATALALDNPTMAVAGGELTLTSADGNTVLVFEKALTCASNWVWQHEGDASHGRYAGDDDQIDSPTSDNGAMVFSGDWLNTGGEDYSGPSTYPAYEAELISPVIDLSSVTAPVALEFNQMGRILGRANTTNGYFNFNIAISTDGGETWGPFIDTAPNLAVNAAPINGTTYIPISGVIGESNVRIKFVYNQNFYFWVLDDIKIIQRPDFDLQAMTNFFGIMPSAQTPASMTDLDVPFMADVQNIGGMDANNVTYELAISSDATGDNIFTSSIDYGTIMVDTLVENQIFPEQFNASGNDMGTYSGKYTLALDSTDARPQNNVIDWSFNITDSLYAKDFGPTRSVAPADGNSFFYGCTYYIPTTIDLNQQLGFRSVTFGVANPNELEDASVSLLVYKWEGDNNEDGSANEDEYGTPVALNSYQFTGSEPANSFFTIDANFDGAFFEFEPGFHYTVMVQYIDNSANGDQPCFLLASEELDYAAMVSGTAEAGTAQYSSLLEVGDGTSGSPAFSIVGFGFDIVPSVYLNVIENPLSTKDNVLAGDVAIIAPNPVTDVANIQFQLEEQADVTIDVMDATGKVVLTRNIGSQWNSIYELDVTAFTAGSYFVKIQTENGFKSIPMVVTK